MVILILGAATPGMIRGSLILAATYMGRYHIMVIIILGATMLGMIRGFRLPATTYVGRYHIMVIIILGASMLSMKKCFSSRLPPTWAATTSWLSFFWGLPL